MSARQASAYIVPDFIEWTADSMIAKWKIENEEAVRLAAFVTAQSTFASRRIPVPFS